MVMETFRRRPVLVSVKTYFSCMPAPQCWKP
jgi:hypothetical protein